MAKTIHDLTSHDILVAYIAERLDRVVDRLIAIGGKGLAVAGRADHLDWLADNVHAMRTLPITACICPDLEPGSMLGRTPVVAMDDAAMHAATDILVIADDRFQQALYDHALRAVPPTVQLTRLYDRLPVGREPLAALAAPGIVTRSATPKSSAESPAGALKF